MMRLVVAALVVAAAPAAAEQAPASLIQKLEEMLNDYDSKIHEEQAQDDKMYGAYEQWYSDSKENRDRTKLKLSDRESVTTDERDSAKDKAKVAATAVEDAEKDIEAASKSKGLEQTAMEDQMKEFMKTSRDLEDAIRILDLIVDRMKVKEKVSFLQLGDVPSKISARVSSLLTAQAHGEDFASVLASFKELRNQLGDELHSARMKHTEDKGASQLKIQGFQREIENNENIRDDNKVIKATNEEIEEQKNKDLAALREEIKVNDDYLDRIDVQNKQEKKAKEQRDKDRADLLALIVKAQDMIKVGVVKSSAAVVRKTSLLQVANDKPRKAWIDRVVNMLTSQSEAIGSKVLATIAVQASEASGADPFVKVKDLIETLIKRLETEAEEEASHKQQCDKDIAANDKELKAEKENWATKHREIGEAEITISKMSEEISELTESNKDLAEQLSKAQKIRNEEEKENTRIINEAKEASEAVKAVLDEWQKTTLLQAEPETKGSKMADAEKPETMESSTVAAGKDGITGLLDVMHSDFVKLEKDTDADEKTAAADFKKMKDENEATQKENDAAIKEKEGKKTEAESSKATAEGDLQASGQKLEGLDKVRVQLKKLCIDVAISPMEKDQKRKQEIESLEEALTILQQANE